MVLTTDYKNEYVYTGLDDYEISFDYDKVSSLVVTWVSDEGVVSDPKTLDVDYSVVLVSNIVYCRVLTDYGVDGIISIERDTPLTQTWQGVDGTTPPPSGIMLALDRIVWQIQQLFGRLSGTLKIPANEDLDMTVPSVLLRANSFATYGPTGLPSAAAGIAGSPTTTWSADYLLSSTALEASSKLGIVNAEVVSEDTNLVANKSYLITTNSAVTLPSSPAVGDTLDIIADESAMIIQNDAEHSIVYKGKYSTTKGTSGKVELFAGDHVRMVYRGVGTSPNDSGVFLTVPAQTLAFSLAITGNGEYVALGLATSPYIKIMKRTGDTFVALSDPSSLPSQLPFEMDFTPDGKYLALGGNTGGLEVYKRSGDVFTRLSDPASPPTSTVASVKFSPDGKYLAMGEASSPWQRMYSRSGDTFTYIAWTGATSDVVGLDWSSDMTYIARSHWYSPYGSVIKRINEVFTSVINMSGLASVGKSTTVSPDGRYFFFGQNLTPWCQVYKRSGDTFSLLTNALALTARPDSVLFSKDNKYLFIQGSPSIKMFKRSGSSFELLASLPSLPANVNYMDMSDDSRYLVASNNSAWFAWKMGEEVDKQWIVTDYQTTDDVTGDLGKENAQYRFK